jgi:hypothetical protein
MKVVPASFIAMVAAWALPLAGMALGQLATSGRTSDVGVMAFWVGLFALVGWAAAVLPLMLRFKETRIFSDLRFSWLGWSLLAVVVYGLLVVPLFGKELLAIIWYPALMGCIAGFVFAVLIRRRDEKTT